MKHIFKLTLALIILSATIAVAKQKDENSDIGLNFGVDYVSNYIQRGWYMNDGFQFNNGFFFPYVFYDLFNTGLSIGIRGEIPEMMIGTSKEDSDYVAIHPKKRTGKEQKKYSRFIDFNLNYTYNLKELFDFSIGAWHYHTETTEIWPNVRNESYYEYYFFINAIAIPLSPIAKVYYATMWGHNWIPSSERREIAVRLNFSHSIELFHNTSLDFVSEGGYTRRWHDRGILGDISDIDLSAGVSTTTGIITLSSSFHYVIVPGVTKKYNNYNLKIIDIHKFYSQFGISFSI